MRERYYSEYGLIIDRTKIGIEENVSVYDEDFHTIEDICDLLNQQDQRIAELEEQLKNAIVPKFKIGQEVYAVNVLRKDCIDWFIINEIGYCAKYGIYYKTNQDINLYEYYFDIFATKEEAEEKLEELTAKNVKTISLQ